ncbi:MAG TPA: flagellar basal body P-ring formation chaperone FlgA [Stellaceae bacterium]|nr:flagellar basal body P-ring formation chaperone FlgA [Stellaceae bacterium]
MAILAWFSIPAIADSLESPDAIRAAIQDAADRQIVPGRDQTLQIEVGDIDQRIRLPHCDAPDVQIPNATAPTLSARVSCRSPSWTLYVPLRLHAWGMAVVAATNLAPGTRLTAADLTMQRLDIIATNGAYLTDTRQAEGMILRTNIRAGAPILSALLEKPVIVHRGDTVVLTLFDTAVTIRTSVVAMEDGRAGDRILVQNPDSKKTVRAAVADAGAVEIHFDQSRENY